MSNFVIIYYFLLFLNFREERKFDKSNKSDDLLKLKNKRTKELLKSKSNDSDLTVTSSDEEGIFYKIYYVLIFFSS